MLLPSVSRLATGSRLFSSTSSRVSKRLVVFVRAARIGVPHGRQFATVAAATAPASAFPADLGDAIDGAVELKGVMQKASVMRIRRILESDVRHTMPLNEFLEICTANGLDDHDARTLLQDFHRVGIVFHFRNSGNDAVRQTVFLKPEMVTDAMYTEMGFTSPTQRFVEEQERRKREEVKLLREQMAPLVALKADLDARARRHVNRMTWLSFAGLTGIIGTKWYLSYIYFSWDIMEPVTYFTGATVGAIGLFWWIMTNTEYEYTNVYSYFIHKHERRNYARAGFDLEKLRGMESQLRQAEDELRTLELTDYNPRLISAYLENKGINVVIPPNPSNPASPSNVDVGSE